MKEIAKTLKEHRETMQISQLQLAKRTGIAQPKISYYESGKHSPPIEDCITLADFYGITLDELVGRDYGRETKGNKTYNNFGTHNGNVEIK